jgi:hypothetical protein
MLLCFNLFIMNLSEEKQGFIPIQALPIIELKIEYD